MKDIEVKEVIISNLRIRGEGTKHSPIRRITDVFDKDGNLIAINDPTPETFAVFDLVHFANWLNDKHEKCPTIKPIDVYKWLDSIENKNDHQ